MGTWRGFSRVPSPVRGEAGLCSEALPKFAAGLSPICIFGDSDTRHRSPGAHMEFSRRPMEGRYFRALFSEEDHRHLRHALLECNLPRVNMPLRGPGGWGGAGGRTGRSWWEDGEELVGRRGAALPPVLGTLSTPPLLQPRHTSQAQKTSHTARQQPARLQKSRRKAALPSRPPGGKPDGTGPERCRRRRLVLWVHKGRSETTAAQKQPT